MPDESPLISGARKVFNKLEEWGATKDVAKSTPHSKAIDEMNKTANDKRVSDANASFQKKETNQKKETKKKRGYTK